MPVIESRVLLERFCSGDERAAEELVDRFAYRLLELARSRLSPKLSRRVDPEDVVQSALRSFFGHARSGRYELHKSGDLWRLLVAITVNKVRQKVKHHTVQKRAVDAEQSVAGHDSLFGIPPEAISREPSPEEAAVLIEELAQLMSGLSPLHGQIVRLRLEGHSVAETANNARCSERTVHRAIERVKERFAQRLVIDSSTL